MARYAFSASFLVLTLILALMAGLALGAFPLAGSAQVVLGVQEALHSALVRPFGKPLAVGIVLFLGLWPTFLIFSQAVRTTTETPSADTGPEVEPVEPTPESVDDVPEPNATTPLDRMTRRFRDPEPEDPVEADTPETEPADDAEEGSEPALAPEPEPEPEPETEPELPERADETETPEPPVPFDLVPFDDVTPDTVRDEEIALGEIADDHSDSESPTDEGDEPFPADDVAPDAWSGGDSPLSGFGPDDGGLREDADFTSRLPVAPAPGTEIRDERPADRAYASLVRALPYDDADDMDEEDLDEGEALETARPAWLDAVERQAIVMRRQVPPPASPGLSYYGGVPIVPPGFAWPVAKVKGDDVPLHFVMQVDLTAIADEARLDMLPASGILYFFLDLELGLPTGYRVIHADDHDSRWHEAEIPANLSPVYGSESRYSWPWIDSENAEQSGLPQLLPLWFFEPVLARLPEASPVERDGANGPRWWPVCDSVDDELAEVQGNEVWPVNPSPVDADGTLRRPYANFPPDWRAVAVASVQVLEELRKPSFAEACRHRELSDEDVRKMRTQWSQEARECLAWANSHQPFDRVSTQEADMFWDWFRQLEGVNCLVIGRAAVHSVEATLSASPEADGVFDDEALELVRARHALAVHTEDGLSVPTPHRMLAPPSYVQGQLDDIANKEILLLEIAADEGVGLLFGEGVYQFTITPEDLKARRFDKVRLTVSSC